jgi:GT2 family glycosyltransferase
MARVSIIIPNLNGRSLLESCLPLVFGQDYQDFEVVVVDNGSTDDSSAFVEKNYPQVRVLALKENLGFAKAVNEAIRQTKSKYVVLLNNDAHVTKNWLSNLLVASDNHQECASVASKMLVFGKKPIIDGAGDKINIVGQPYPIGRGKRDSKTYNVGKYILGATGGASLFRRVALEKVGLFDEDFFFYFEDVDWALRAQLLGFCSWYEPNAIVYHRFGETAKKFYRKMEYLRFRNTIILVLKNFPWQLFFKRWRFFKISLVWFHTFYYFCKNGLVKEAFNVLFYLIFNFPKIMKKRWAIQGKRKVSIDYFDSLMEEKMLKIGPFRI